MSPATPNPLGVCSSENDDGPEDGLGDHSIFSVWFHLKMFSLQVYSFWQPNTASWKNKPFIDDVPIKISIYFVTSQPAM